MAAFDGTLFDTMGGKVNEAVTNDTGAINTAYSGLAQSMPQSNAYRNATWAQSPQMQASMSRLLGGNSTGTDYGAATSEVQQGQAAADAGFSNLMAMLGANQEGVNASRVAQVGMDQNTANQNVRAQAFGARTGIDLARSRAQQEWARANEERNFQNNMASQQWAREEAQFNAQNQQQYRDQILQPILDMITQANGVGGLNLQPLLALMGR